jgi:hypothetical protein
VSFTIYRSSVVASANFTPADDCVSIIFTGDRLCSYAVAFTEMANLPDAPERVCSVELLYIDSATSEVISVARENASAILLVNGKLFSTLSPYLKWFHTINMTLKVLLMS